MPKSKPSIDYICATCGSGEVMWDAFAEWDATTQQMVLRGTMDQAYCEKCGGECDTVEVATLEKDDPDYDDQGNLKPGIHHD